MGYRHAWCGLVGVVEQAHDPRVQRPYRAGGLSRISKEPVEQRPIAVLPGTCTLGADQLNRFGEVVLDEPHQAVGLFSGGRPVRDLALEFSEVFDRGGYEEHGSRRDPHGAMPGVVVGLMSEMASQISSTSPRSGWRRSVLICSSGVRRA
jgi:hypothetical protein